MSVSISSRPCGTRSRTKMSRSRQKIVLCSTRGSPISRPALMTRVPGLRSGPSGTAPPLTALVLLRRAAELDLAGIEDWYEGQQAGLGSEFRGAVDELFGRIAGNPLAYPERYRTARRALVRRFSVRRLVPGTAGRRSRSCLCSR